MAASSSSSMKGGIRRLDACVLPVNLTIPRAWRRHAPNETLEGYLEDIFRWLLPFAVAAVAIVLIFGLFNMLRGGNPNLSQKLMRARALLQLVALLIAMAIFYFASSRP